MILLDRGAFPMPFVPPSNNNNNAACLRISRLELDFAFRSIEKQMKEPSKVA